MQGKLTYGKIGEWRFDKRSYDKVPPPRNLTLPPPGVSKSVVWFSQLVLCSIEVVFDALHPSHNFYLCTTIFFELPHS